MELYQVMRTTFAARRFTDEALPDDVLVRILDNARFAPSGGNRQGWRVIVVRDRATREALVELVTPYTKRYRAQVDAGESPFNTWHPTAVDAETIERTEPPARLAAPLIEAPVVLVLCIDLAVVASMDQDLERVGIVSGASVYPLAWNILLAARNEGYGGNLTTLVCAPEPEVKFLLGIPEQFAVAAAMPLGKPVKQLTKLKRKPVEEFTMTERWGGAPLTG